MQLLLASNNPGKVREMREILAPLGVALKTPRDFPQIPEPAEDGATFEENAVRKARHWAEATGICTLADDSGLEVDALGGAPGVHSARYAPTAPERNAKLLAALQDVPRERRTARFVCVAAIAWPDGRVVTGRGECPGRIHDAPRGSGGFGYDPIFWLDEFGCTMAELPAETKNRVSHRGKALAAMRPIFEGIGDRG
jgi:XTP/dITP diphosphohydrolase